MIQRQIVIVGAGPAGMAAAMAVQKAGITPTVIDENPQVGGQIYRQPSASFTTGDKEDGNRVPDTGDGIRVEFLKHADRMEVLNDTTVWGVFPEKQLAVRRQDGWEMIHAEQLVFTTGAYEFVSPFPGWTVPGVMTPGGAQSMVKAMQVLPGKRVLVAGSGPFLLVVANQLHAAGMEVVGVVEAVRRSHVVRHAPGLLADLNMLREGRRYFRQLREAGIPFHWNHVVVEARGGEELTEVDLAPCDQQWRADRDRIRSVKVDTLCVGYGFVPRTELAQLTGCRLRFENLLGGWVPEVDHQFQTSVPGVFVAGDGGGVAGAVVAQVEGTLAGLAAAHRAGQLDDSDYDTRCRPLLLRLAKLRRFRSSLDRIYQIGPGLVDLPRDDTTVCRCEEVTLAEAECGMKFGGQDFRTQKVMTRLGMGPCQGQMCWPAMARRIAARDGKGKQPDACGPRSVRPPTQPLLVGDLLDQSAGWPASAASACANTDGVES